MASADFSQFVITTADRTACETSPVKVRVLSLHAPAAFTRTSDNFWTLMSFATLSVFPSLICGSCPSGQRFAYSFFQIPSHGGHPCCSAMCFVVAYAHSGLSPVRKRPCWANKNRRREVIPCACTSLQVCKLPHQLQKPCLCRRIAFAQILHVPGVKVPCLIASAGDLVCV